MKIEETIKDKKKIKGTERALIIWAIGSALMVFICLIKGNYSVFVQELSSVTLLCWSPHGYWISPGNI